MGEKQEKSASNIEGEKKSDGGVNTIVLKFDMHCEGCAKKVRKSINKLEGVESVKTDCPTNKLMVTGKVDPVFVKERVEAKIKRKAELVSLQSNKAGNGVGGGGADGDGGGKKKSDYKIPDDKKSEGKSEDKNKSKDKENPKEAPVTTVHLKTRVHCEGCAQKIKIIVSKCEGVQDVNVDLQKDLITTRGTMNMNELLPYLNVKLKRAVELAPTKKDGGSGAGDKKAKDPGDGQEKPKEGGGKSEKPKGSDNSAEKKEGGGNKKEDVDKKEASDGGKKNGGSGGGEASLSKNNSTRIEVSKMEYNPNGGYDNAYSYAYDPRQQSEGSYGHHVVEYWHAPEYSQPPQMFSDENPNACYLM